MCLCCTGDPLCALYLSYVVSYVVRCVVIVVIVLCAFVRAHATTSIRYALPQRQYRFAASLVLLNGAPKSLLFRLLAHKLLVHTSHLVARVQVFGDVCVARRAPSAEVVSVVGQEH